MQDEAGGEADRERDRPAGRSAHERPASHALLDQLEPGEEEQEDEPQVGEEVDVAVDLRQAKPLGADEDPKHDLEHDGGEDDPSVDPGEDGPGTRGGEHEHERAGVRQRGRRSNRDEAITGTARVRGPTCS